MPFWPLKVALAFRSHWDSFAVCSVVSRLFGRLNRRLRKYLSAPFGPPALKSQSLNHSLRRLGHESRQSEENGAARPGAFTLKAFTE